jgi:hypothetical protein
VSATDRGVQEVVEGAAAALPVRGEAQGDADDVVARGDAARGRDGAVDAAAHRDDHALAHAALPARICATRRGRHAHDAVDVVLGRRRPEAQAKTPPRLGVAPTHGAQHVRRLGGSGGARRPERCRDPLEIEEDE